MRAWPWREAHRAMMGRADVVPNMLTKLPCEGIVSEGSKKHLHRAAWKTRHDAIITGKKLVHRHSLCVHFL